MAFTMMLKNSASFALRNFGRRGPRGVGVIAAIPSSRPQVTAQKAFYHNQQIHAASDISSSCYAPCFSYGLIGHLNVLNSMLASDWLREPSWRVHPMGIATQHDCYEIEADCPGMGDEDIKVEVSPERVLTISGARTTTEKTHPASGASNAPAETLDQPTTAASPAGADSPDGQAPDAAPKAEPAAKGPSSDTGQAGFHVSYRFSRSFMLPDDADVENVRASLDKGVLTISVPRHKAEKPQPRRITINSGAAAPRTEQ